MANEIQLSVQLAANKDKLQENFSRSGSFTLTGSRSHPGSQLISISGYDDLNIRTDFTPGLAAFVNLSEAAYIEIGIEVASAFYPTDRMNPGESIVKRLVPGVTYFAVATAIDPLDDPYLTGAELEWLVLED